jgi:hypothetical protein
MGQPPTFTFSVSGHLELHTQLSATQATRPRPFLVQKTRGLLISEPPVNQVNNNATQTPTPLAPRPLVTSQKQHKTVAQPQPAGEREPVDPIPSSSVGEPAVAAYLAVGRRADPDPAEPVNS